MKKRLWLICIITGFLIRLLLSQVGYNYDVASWNLVGEIVSQGEVIYAHSSRFNYGFILSYILGLFYWLNNILLGGEIEGMHFLVALLCSIFDVLIAFKLKENYGKKVALLFFLNPISILITGYHSQLDNIAIYFAFLAWLFLQAGKAFWKVVSLLGVSLIIKHVFILFLPWLLFDRRYKIKQRLFLFVTPLVLFLGSFSPFMLDTASRTGVQENVFAYQSFEENSLLYRISDKTPNFNSINKTYFGNNGRKLLFMGILTLLGIFYMRQRPEHSFYIYLLGLVAFSSGMSDQYLTIPCIAIAVFYRNKVLWLFTIVGSLYLIFDSRNNISGAIVSLQQFTDSSPALAMILSGAVCQLLLIVGIISIPRFEDCS
jgi:hypothetical protein